LLITPRPPLSTLFPYTTLFRSVRGEARKMALLAVDDLLQRHLLSHALPGPRRDAAEDSRLCAAVRRVQRDRLDRRVRLRALPDPDRKSTRLNSSHDQTSYAVFC